MSIAWPALPPRAISATMPTDSAVTQDQLSQDLASLKIDRTPRPRGGSGRGTTLVVGLVVVAALGLLGYFLVYPTIRSALFTKEVKTAEVRLESPAQAQVQLTASGYVVALISAKVASKLPGRIAEIFVVEGQVIEKDAKVARLEDVDFKSGLGAARARGAAARSRIQIARANLAELEVAIAREKPLVAKGVTAKATLDDLEARASSLRASVASAQAEAAAADAETRSLDVQLGSYLITTPIAGTVVDKLVEVGEGVAPGFGTPGVVEVVDMNSLVVEVDVPEARLSQVKEGDPCEIVLDAYPSSRLEGSVKEIGRRINRAKATVPVKVQFNARPDKRLIKVGAGAGKPMTILPEMSARVSFLSEKLDPKVLDLPDKLVVPVNAVVQRNGADVVFVYDEGNVRMVSVKLGEAVGEGRELLTGPPKGTRVVLDPPSDLKPGEKVKEKK